jgi:hypothetical protein
MFHASLKRLRAWLELADDLLGDPPPAPALEPQLHRDHPHRLPLRWQRARRAGAVAAAPAHCLSPVRASAPRSAGRSRVLP